MRSRLFWASLGCLVLVIIVGIALIWYIASQTTIEAPYFEPASSAIVATNQQVQTDIAATTIARATTTVQPSMNIVLGL